MLLLSLCHDSGILKAKPDSRPDANLWHLVFSENGTTKEYALNVDDNNTLTATVVGYKIVLNTSLNCYTFRDFNFNVLAPQIIYNRFKDFT